MAIQANPKLTKSGGYHVSPWLADTVAELKQSEEIGSLEFPGGELQVLKGTTSIWGRLRWNKCQGGLLLRFHYAVSNMKLEQCRDLTSIHTESPCGKAQVAIAMPNADLPLIHWTCTLTPATDLVYPFWPRDLIPICRDDNPLGTKGTIFTTQRGPKAALIYASLEEPAAGAFLYMQDLTSLNDYCDQTQTEPKAVVGGEWPEMGFRLPSASEKPLKAGKPVVISDAYVALSNEMPKGHSHSARVFLDLFASIYRHLKKPETEYHDWLARARDTLRDLDTTPGCTTRCRGLRYLNAYHGLEKFPPESMVQLSVIVPMMDYAARRKIDVPLIKELGANVASFFNPSLNTLVRYLPGEDFSAAREPQQKHDLMDSWYLYHTLINAGRMAMAGDEQAKRLMIESIPYAIKVGRRFRYHWPIFYDMNTLKPEENVSGSGYGETDVAGLYAHLMLHALELTGDKQYLDEACRAADTLEEYGFEMAYQLNSTLYGAMALAGLWTRTRKAKYRDLSFVCMANFLVNCWMWQCQYGHGKSYPTFFGLPPLQDGEYIAIYEESESLAAMASYLSGLGEDCPESLQMLLPEYCKYLLHRSWYAFPTELPRKIIAEETKDGAINPRIAIPLEDMGSGRYAPGQVGQEVYGAGAPLIFAAFTYHEAADGDFAVFCDYIVTDSKARGNTRKGEVRLDIAGAKEMTARIRVVPLKVRKLPPMQARQGRSAIALKKVGRDLEGRIHGGERVIIRWG